MLPPSLPNSVARCVALDYHVADVPALAAFLAACPFVEPVLADAPAALRDCFPDAPLSLEVFRDADTGVESLVLVIEVSAYLSVEEAVDQLGTFDQTWWRAVAPLTEGRMLVDFAWPDGCPAD